MFDLVHNIHKSQVFGHLLWDESQESKLPFSQNAIEVVKSWICKGKSMIYKQ